jgi:hypothetical protein
VRRVLAGGAVVLALGVGFVAGWFAHSPGSPNGSSPQPATGTISGRLLAVGGPADDTWPLGGRSFAAIRGNIFVPTGSGRFTASVGSDGEYSITVPPGQYTVEGRSPQYNGGRTPCLAAKMPVIVRDGGHVVANVLCQVK